LAPPYAGLAEVEAYRMQSSFISPSVAIPKIYQNLDRAIELNPNSANAHYIKAVIAVWTEWNWKKGEQEFVQSLELNPSNAPCRAFYGHLLMILRRPEEAIRQANLAFSLDQYEPVIRSLTGGGNSSGNPQDRILFHKKTLLINPDHRLTKINLSVVYRNLGDYEKWFELWKEVNRYNDQVIA
jgi:Tfp pilus assembly protein PilF